LTYKWKRNGVTLGGATFSTYIIPSVTAGDAGGYSVEIGDLDGIIESSPSAALTVEIPADIGTQPAGAVINQGSSYTMLVTPTGTGPFTYQWTKNSVNIPGATSASFTVSNAMPADAASYGVIVSNVLSGVTYSKTSSPAALSVTVPPTITGAPVAGTVAVGAPVNLSVSASGTTPFTYQWRRNSVNLSGATDASYSLASAQTADSGTYTVEVRNAAGTATSAAAVLSVEIPPSISMQPVGGTIAVNTGTTFSVTASGTGPLGYQWRKDSVNVPGATAASFTLASAQTADSGTYTVVVQNAVGTASSVAAVLSVEIPPSISLQPVGGTIAVNTGTTFSVTASGTGPFSYQWRKNATDVAGATSASYSLAAPQTTDSGTYTVVVRNAVGTATSAAAVLSVEVPPSISSQIVGGTIAVNTGTTFSVTATGTDPLGYQWRKDSVNVPGATAASFTLSPAQISDSGTYTVEVRNTVGTAVSVAAVLSVEIPPSVSTEPVGGTIAVNTGTTFSVTASGTGPFSYQWRKNSVDVPGATAASYSLAAPQTADSGTYTVVVRNAVGTATSQGAVLTVLEPVNVTTPPAAQIVEIGGTASFSVSTLGSAPLTYQWLKDSVAIAGANAASYSITNASAASGGSYSVVVSNPVSSQTSAPAKLVVAPQITAQVVNKTATVGVPVTLSVTAVGSGTLTYQWQNSAGADIAGETAATYTLANPRLKDAGTYTVRVSNEAGGGYQRTSAAKLTVAEPAVLKGIISNPASGAAVETTPTKTSFASFTADIAMPYPMIAFNGYGVSDSPISYQWSHNGIPIVSGGTSKVLQITSVTAASAGSYSVVATSAAGTLTAGPVQFIALKPVTIVTQPQPATVNVGSLLSLNVQVTGTEPLTYQWFNTKMEPIAGATSGTLTFPSITAADAGDYTVFVQNYYLGAAISSVYSTSAKVTVNPPPVMKLQPESAFATVGGIASFSASADGTPPFAYQWRKDGVDIVGATGSTYALAGIQHASAGNYSCVISTPKGSVTSNTAALTVFDPLSITTQLVGGTVVLGGSYTFTVAASGPGPLTYQWRKDGAAIATSSYTFKPGLFTWHQAKADAEASGGHLATISNAAEWTALVAQLSAAGHSGKTAWLGGYQPNGSSEPGGGWIWLGGEPLSYLKWRSSRPGEAPAGGIAQQYLAATVSATGDWDDTENAPSVMGGYVLEIESSSPSLTVPASAASAAEATMLSF
jgi:hypothetical protein